MTRQTPSPKPTSGASARDRLLEAGVDVFGKYGYEAATTRMIARQAGANLAAIPYYFNGKEGLYLATVSFIVEKIEAQLSSSIREITGGDAGTAPSRETAIGRLEILLSQLINFMIGSPLAPRFARIILREQLYPSFAYDVIFDHIMAPMIHAIATSVATVTGESSDRINRLRALTIVGQVMAFRVARETVVRDLGLEGYTPEETEEIRRIVVEQTRASLMFSKGA